MTYKIIFNGRIYYEEKIRVKDWMEFIDRLTKLTYEYKEPPDLIYLISIRD